MRPLLDCGRLLIWFLLFLNVNSIREDGDYEDDVGIAENDHPMPEKEEDPSTMHEDATKLEKYLASRVSLCDILNKIVIISRTNHMFWMDPRLHWNPAEYNDQWRVFLHFWEVWSPQFSAINSVKPLYEESQYSRIQARKNKNFYYLYKCPGVRTTVDCEMDAAAFPYDTQNCSVILTDVELTETSFLCVEKMTKFSAFQYFRNRTHFGGWEMKRMSFKELSFSTPYYCVIASAKPLLSRMAYVITLSLEREETFYTTTFLIPSFFLFLLSKLKQRNLLFISISVLSANLILLALFITSSYKKFPIHYSATPRIVAFWQFEVLITTIQWFLCIALLI
ncbi:hypothetical protein PFISCL1PPCAC_21964, partial [Pristionchus fissidentatus]